MKDVKFKGIIDRRAIDSNNKDIKLFKTEIQGDVGILKNEPKDIFGRDIMPFKEQPPSLLDSPFKKDIQETVARVYQDIKDKMGGITEVRNEQKKVEKDEKKIDFGNMLHYDAVKYEIKMRKFNLNLPDPPPQYNAKLEITRKALKEAYEFASKLKSRKI